MSKDNSIKATITTNPLGNGVISSGSLYGSTGTISGGYTTISGGYASNVTVSNGTWTTSGYIYNGNEHKSEYKLCGHRFKLDRSLSNDELNFITMFTMNGIKYYNLMIENGFNLEDDLKQSIEPLIKIIGRKEKIGTILKNNKDEKC